MRPLLLRPGGFGLPDPSGSFLTDARARRRSLNALFCSPDDLQCMRFFPLVLVLAFFYERESLDATCLQRGLLPTSHKAFRCLRHQRLCHTFPFPSFSCSFEAVSQSRLRKYLDCLFFRPAFFSGSGAGRRLRKSGFELAEVCPTPPPFLKRAKGSPRPFSLTK